MFSMKIRVLPCLFLLLSACDTIGDAADSLGTHMPVIGERCEHWQCLTAEGQRRSDEIKSQRAAQERKPLLGQPQTAATLQKTPAPPAEMPPEWDDKEQQ